MLADLDMQMDASMDIDAFVAFIQHGEMIPWQSPESKSIYQKIKMACK